MGSQRFRTAPAFDRHARAGLDHHRVAGQHEVDRVRLRPSHTDPTVNLHDVFYAIEGDRVVDVWPIAARGYPEHRVFSL